MDVLLKEKNRRILELEEKQAKLNAQLKKALFGDALGEANALAKQREAELETMKTRTVAKFKEMTKEKQVLEARVQALEQSAAAASSMPAASPAGTTGEGLASPSAFDSPAVATRSDGGATGLARQPCSVATMVFKRKFEAGSLHFSGITAALDSEDDGTAAQADLIS